MKKLFFLASCLVVLGSSPVWAGADDPTVVVVRVIERYNSARLVIDRGSGTPEIIELENGGSEKDASAVAAAYQRAIAKLYAQGYVLQATLSNTSIVPVGLSGGNASTMVFVKAPKP